MRLDTFSTPQQFIGPIIDAREKAYNPHNQNGACSATPLFAGNLKIFAADTVLGRNRILWLPIILCGKTLARRRGLAQEPISVTNCFPKKNSHSRTQIFRIQLFWRVSRSVGWARPRDTFSTLVCACERHSSTQTSLRSYLESIPPRREPHLRNAGDPHPGGPFLLSVDS